MADAAVSTLRDQLELLTALEREMGEPGFWDDQDRAAKVSAEHARVGRRLAAYREVEAGVDELEELEELADEDPSIAAEVDEQRTALETRLAELEEERLFSGP